MAYQQLNQFSLPPGFRGRGAVVVQLWWIVQGVLFRPSPQFLYGWRRFLLRLFGAKIGKGVIVRPSVSITYPWKLTIDDYAWVGDDVDLYTLGEIEIGKNSVVSQRSYLCTGSHDFEDLSFAIYAKKITIKEECWLATDVFVAPGVTIGKGAVVGARSSVFKTIDGGKVYMGTPVKVVKERPESA